MFEINEKVVCIEEIIPNDKLISLGVRVPLKNEIYTIREFDRNNTTIRLLEIINPMLKFYDGLKEVSFLIDHFRKLEYTFAENLLKEITEQVKEEQLQVLI